MFGKFKQLSLVYQLSLAFLLITIVIFSSLTIFASKQTADGAIHSVEKELGREVELMAATFEFFNESLTSETSKLSDIFFSMFAGGAFNIDTSNETQVAKFKVPTLLFNGEVINNNFSRPDAFTSMTGGSATIFMRHNDDFLRVSTSLKKQDGSRAFGTMLGNKHPGYKTLMEGKAYEGPANLFGRNYMTKYVPFKDQAGNVIGILYIGFNYTDQLNALKKRIQSIKFGDTGYAYIISAAPGPKQGVLQMHPTLEGENLLEMKDASGEMVFQKLLGSDAGTIHYQWKSAENAAAQDMLASFKHIKGWDWVVAAGSYTSEFTKESIALRNSLVAASVISAMIMVGLMFLMLRKQLHPLGLIGSTMEALGQGDLTLKVDMSSYRGQGETQNEIQLLSRQIETMVGALRELITGILNSVELLGSTTQRVSHVVDQTRDGVMQQTTETDLVATAINEMAATAQEVANNARSAADETRQADSKTVHGSQVVSNVIESIKELAQESENSTLVISRVEQESNNIGSVLEVIRGIAEQTNLLALNAAIEAARAGEQGRGFAVVADEVRNLAQKTQESTKEINDMIQRLQTSSKEAVTAMESGREKAQNSADKAGEAGETLSDIASSTSAIADVTLQIASAAEEQTAVAEDLNQGVIRIRDISRATAEGADEMGAVTSELQSVADQLQTATERFRV